MCFFFPEGSDQAIFIRCFQSGVGDGIQTGPLQRVHLREVLQIRGDLLRCVPEKRQKWVLVLVVVVVVAAAAAAAVVVVVVVGGGGGGGCGGVVPLQSHGLP